MRVFVFVLVMLGGCATVPPAPTVTTACIELKDYSPAQEKALGAAVKALDPSNPLVEAMLDYGKMRAADRACLASH